MRTLIVRIAIVTAGFAADAAVLNAEHELALKVSPTMTNAPGHVVVTATVGRHPDNRSLEVAAISNDFFRSSQFPLEGEQAPRITQFELKNLPGGQYDVVLVLHRAGKAPAVIRRSVLVTSSHAGH